MAISILSQGMQLCSLSLAALCFILEMTAHAKDFHYQTRETLTPKHDHFDHIGILRNEEFTRKEYFSTTNRDLWYEPMALLFIVLSILMYSGYIYLSITSTTVGNNVFLVMVVNGVQMYLLGLAALLILKSYMVYDNGYFDSFVRGLKIHHFGLEKDAYMRLYCYDGYFTHDLRDNFHYDEEKLKMAATSTSSFRSHFFICQESGLKLSTVILLTLSAICCACAQWFAFCLEVTVVYGGSVRRTSKVSPDCPIGRTEVFHNKDKMEMTQNRQSGNNQTTIEYLEEDDEVAFSMRTDDDIDVMQFEIANKENSKP